MPAELLNVDTVTLLPKLCFCQDRLFLSVAEMVLWDWYEVQVCQNIISQAHSSLPTYALIKHS